MWTNPKYQAPAAPSPPAEQGQRLATFARGKGEELRVSLAEYQGHPYISVRVWERDQKNGSWWPVKAKGVSIRLKEAAALAEALGRVESALAGTSSEPEAPPTCDDPARPEERPKFVDKRRQERRDWNGTNLSVPRGGADFDEFAI